jgi:hypothetical protein
MSYQMPAPVRSADQRYAALRAANSIRSERARFRRQLGCLERHQAERMVAALVERPPEWAASLRVGDLLTYIPKRGVVWAGKLMRRHRIAAGVRCGALTERQKAALVQELAG